MTGIHDLLDAVSTGQPQATVSVEDLVRKGRRHQRRLASGLGGATAAVVVAVSVAITAHGAARPATTPGAASAPPEQPDRPAAIPAAHVFSGGTSVGTYLETLACARPPELRVVSQDAGRVVVSLTIPGLGAPGKGTWLRSGATTPATCGLFPATGTAAEFHGPTFGGEVTAELQAPLGSRTLIDASTGRTIPYTSDSTVAEPTWLPDGWGDDQALHPVDLHTWEHDWRLGSSSESLSLRQTQQATANLGGTANAMVGQSEARLDATSTTLHVTWFAAGWQYELNDYQAIECRQTQKGSTDLSCPTTPVPLRRLTQADLLHVADAVSPR